MHTGEKIRHFREFKGFSQEYMGERLGMSQQVYSRIEHGDKPVTVELLQLIASVLEVEPMQIFEFNNGPVFLSNNQQGGNANNYHHHETSRTDLLEKINMLLGENIKLKEEILQLHQKLESKPK
jgi:transcriptional regulator with XRE-family HTH domain